MGELGAVRQEIATVFFFLAVLVLFDLEMDKKIQKLLIILFLFTTLISHYSTAYVAFILILPILLWPFFNKLIKERKLVFTNFDIILISMGMILIWYILVAKVQFAIGSERNRLYPVCRRAEGRANGSRSFEYCEVFSLRC